MADTDDTTYFMFAVGADGTVIAQRIAPTEATFGGVGPSVITYTGASALAKADAARYAIGCLLGCVPVPAVEFATPYPPRATINIC